MPLGLLSLGAVVRRLRLPRRVHRAESGRTFWHGSVAFNEHLMHAMHEVPALVKWSPIIVMLIGLAIAWYAYIRKPGIPGERSSRSSRRSTSSCSTNGISTNSTTCIFVRPAMCAWPAACGSAATRGRSTASARTARRRWSASATSVTARLQSGYVYTYAFVMLIGLVGAATWVIWRDEP